MLACVLAWIPLLIYSPCFQLSVAVVFGILLLRKPLRVFVERTLLRPFERPPELLSNLLTVSLAAQDNDDAHHRDERRRGIGD
jgi:predicted membrane metal-binding protein